MGLLASLPIEDACSLAWHAGAAYVQHPDNRPVSIDELARTIDPIAAKYYLPPRERDYTLAFTNGCFDLLHPGHLSTLRFAKGQADRLIVAVNSDESVRMNKGSSRPVQPLADRMAMIAALDCVDHVVSFGEATPIRLIESIRPDMIVKGSDYQYDQVSGANIARVVIAPSVPGYSTTSTISKLQGTHS